MASEPDPSVQALIERLITIPLFASFSTTRPDSSPDHETTRIVLINPLTQGMVVIGGNNNNNFDFTDLTKSGQPPATQASIDGLERREVKCSEEIERLGGECVICMEEWSVGDVVSEMPCKHKYHGGCVEKWLKIHGSCPVCRFKMPVDDNNQCRLWAWARWATVEGQKSQGPVGLAAHRYNYLEFQRLVGDNWGLSDRFF